MNDLCLEFLTVHGNELRLLVAKAYPLITLIMSSIAEKDTTFNVIIYNLEDKKYINPDFDSS